MLYPELGDAELEGWFLRHAVEAGTTEDYSLIPVAPWLPLVGIPANDR